MIIFSIFQKPLLFINLVDFRFIYFLFSILIIVEDLVTLHCTKILLSFQIKCSIYLEDLKNLMVKTFKFVSKHEWFVDSSLSWLKTIICYLDPVSPLEYRLNIFSEYVSKFQPFLFVSRINI